MQFINRFAALARHLGLLRSEPADLLDFDSEDRTQREDASSSLNNGEPELETFEFKIFTPYDDDDRMSQFARSNPQSRPAPVPLFKPNVYDYDFSQPKTRPRAYSDGFLKFEEGLHDPLVPLRNLKRSASVDRVSEFRLANSGQADVPHISSLELPSKLKGHGDHKNPLSDLLSKPLSWTDSIESVSLNPVVFQVKYEAVPTLVPLIKDINLAGGRVLLTKTQYRPFESSRLAPFPSCLIGFHVVVDPHPGTRVKHLNIRLSLQSHPTEHDSKPPVIQAIYPRDGEICETGERSPVHIMQDRSVGLQLGVDKYGTVQFHRGQSIAYDSFTVPYVSTSGVHTSLLKLTMSEDRRSKSGVVRSLYFAALLKLDISAQKPFQATMELDTKPREDLPWSWWFSQGTWNLDYDGKSEFGPFVFSMETILKRTNEETYPQPIPTQLLIYSALFCAFILVCGYFISFPKNQSK
ncbi:hypothetical protein PGT21_034485 [Puccinia graminis f. sp. tritici]|uniref:Protein PBN1 n=2 Tax=Puccinia graminis f. sp. tritici TaxID=56615 RepID=H6QU95_PUCGT|nr:uncharacterized protein PGTG_22281 [Puccinia graminis f. sp. tritici CRL 75-36-700-3]EHS64558.1 hypothetical protein PGTG_22281 [Puccinia graminis f. sp. tritici CRL 75-36-700-3]KAA1101976.1 hypothetical protein PGT21_034485 [Puccinia graminis f. sp. tritici]